MVIIHTFLSRADTKHLSSKDTDYLRRKLDTNSMLNNILNKPTNRQLLHELHCVLDRAPAPRRKTRQYERCSKIKVFNLKGELIRIEYANGKVMKEI